MRPASSSGTISISAGAARARRPACGSSAARGLRCASFRRSLRPGVVVSSSAIREALEARRHRAANALLGHRWFVCGEVRHGDEARPDASAFRPPTAPSDECAFRHGIYAVRAAVAAGETRDGVASFGRRPTFDNGAPLLEVFLFDFSGDLYGQSLEVEFVAWIRGEERFRAPRPLSPAWTRTRGGAADHAAALPRPDGPPLIG